MAMYNCHTAFAGLKKSKTFTITPILLNCSACAEPFYQNQSSDNALKLNKLFLNTINIDLTSLDLELDTNDRANRSVLSQLSFCPHCICKLNELNSLLDKLDNLQNRIQNAKDYICATVTNTSFRLKYGFENSNSRLSTSAGSTKDKSSSSSSSFISQMREKVIQNWISVGQARNEKPSTPSSTTSSSSTARRSRNTDSPRQPCFSTSDPSKESSIPTTSESLTLATRTNYERIDVFNPPRVETNEEEQQHENGRGEGGEEEELVVGMSSNIANLYEDNKDDMSDDNDNEIIPSQLLLIQDEDEEQSSSSHNNDSTSTQIKIEPGSLRSLPPQDFSSNSISNPNSNCSASARNDSFDDINTSLHQSGNNIICNNNINNIHNNFGLVSDEVISSHRHHSVVDSINENEDENSCVEIPGLDSWNRTIFYDENTDFPHHNNNFSSTINGQQLQCASSSSSSSSLNIINKSSHEEQNGMYSVSIINNDIGQQEEFFTPLMAEEDSTMPSHSPKSNAGGSRQHRQQQQQQRSYKIPATRAPKFRSNQGDQVYVEMCTLCYKYILNGDQLGHLCEGKSTTSRYQCGYCPATVFYSERVLIDHVCRHLQNQMLVARTEASSSNKDMNMRQTSSTGSSSNNSGSELVAFSCKLCKRKFSSVTGLAAHMKCIHHGSSIVRCQLCFKAFNDGSKLKLHMATAHHHHNSSISQQQLQLQQTIKVPTSPKTNNTSSPDKLGKKRIRPVIGTNSTDNNKMFRCPYCSKGFRLRNDMKRHTLIHTGERPFKCSICGKAFNRNHHLKTHIDVHKRKGEVFMSPRK